MRSLLFAVALLFASSAQAVTIDWVLIGNPGNPADTFSIFYPNCAGANCGSVAYDYYISKYETTNTQYAEFLNAKAASDPLGLYSTGMGSDASLGGIMRSGSSGSYNYAVKAGFANKPVTYVSFYDALRFSNWLKNGQGSADTETGAYTLLNGPTVMRNDGASIFLPSENEWYKAAYYSPGGVYFDYPTETDRTIGCVLPDKDNGNSANCWPATSRTGGALTDVGAYGLSFSPYGTFDQGGNVWESNEQILLSGSAREFRGGGLDSDASWLGASSWYLTGPSDEGSTGGFRVASLVPEPGTGLLVMTGVLALAASRKRRAQ